MFSLNLLQRPILKAFAVVAISCLILLMIPVLLLATTRDVLLGKLVLAISAWRCYQRTGRGKNGAPIIEDVNETANKILYLHEQLGFDRFAAHMDVGGPDHADLMQAIELFGNEIVPRVKKALAAKQPAGAATIA